MKMNIKPSFGYQFKDLLKSSLGFFIVVIALFLVIPLVQALFGADVEISFSGYGAIVAIFFFVMGMVAPRSFVRMDAQMGVSRNTCFVSQLLSMLAVIACLCAGLELVATAVQLIFSNSMRLDIMDIYQMAYHEGETLTFAGHLISVGFNVCLCSMCYAIGMFFTYLFWRLSKVGTIIAVIAMIVLFNLGLGNIVSLIRIDWLREALESFGRAAIESPTPLILLFLCIAAISAVIAWLLLRRAFIRAGK